jgi:DHA2 family multidrug resistance protein-like MFS transporter
MLALTMASLDSAIVNTALPTIGQELNTDAASSVWAVTAYQLSMVATILPLASLADSFGHRRLYLTGLCVFTIASFFCGISQNLPELIVARVVQGLGAAAIMAINASIVRFIFPSRMLGRGVGLNSFVVGLAFTAGPTVASLILSVSTWHWLFLINVPIGVLAFSIGSKTLPKMKGSGHSFDAISAALCAAFLALLVLGFGGITHQSAWLPIAIEWVIAGVCVTVLIHRQKDHPAPVLALDLFKIPIFSLSVATAICSFATQGLAFVSLPFMLQNILGRSQVETGYLITPWPLAVAVMAPIAGRLSDKYPVGILGGAGLLMMSLGMASLAWMPSDPTAFEIGWRMVICGTGFGFFQSPNLRALLSAAPPGRGGGASGIIGTARLVGQTIGAALVALCLLVSQTHGSLVALWLGCGFAAVGSAMSFLRLLAR